MSGIKLENRELDGEVKQVNSETHSLRAKWDDSMFRIAKSNKALYIQKEKGEVQ